MFSEYALGFISYMDDGGREEREREREREIEREIYWVSNCVSSISYGMV